MRAFSTSLVLAIALAATSAAQSLNFPDFSNVSSFSFNGTAAQSGNMLRVAPSNTGGPNKGSVYHQTPLTVAAGFDTTFTFRITNISISGGSGLTFIIHNDASALTALGDQAWAMGYAEFAANPGTGINDSLVFELDTFGDFASQNDPSHSHLSIHTNGSGDNMANEDYSLGSWSTPTDLSDGLIHTLRIVYVPGTLDVYYDGSAMPVLSVAYDFATGGTIMNGTNPGGLNLIGAQDAYVGWTAAMPPPSSNQHQDHDVLSWTWQSFTPPVYPGNGTDAAMSVAVNGSPDAGAGNVHSVAGGDIVAIQFDSPGGTLIGTPMLAFLQTYATGMAPAAIPGIPLFFDFALPTVVLLDGLSNPGGLLSPLLGGNVTVGTVPPLLGGTSTSFLVNLLVIDNSLALGFGIAEAHEFEIQ